MLLRASSASGVDGNARRAPRCGGSRGLAEVAELRLSTISAVLHRNGIGGFGPHRPRTSREPRALAARRALSRSRDALLHEPRYFVLRACRALTQKYCLARLGM